MFVLILEDSEERIKQFKQRFIGITVPDIAINAQFAIAFIKTKTYDYIFLDHDLGGEMYVDTRNINTGSEVARYIASNNIPCKHIFIHSMNYPASLYMARILENTHKISVIPGIWTEPMFNSRIKHYFEKETQQ